MASDRYNAVLCFGGHGFLVNISIARASPSAASDIATAIAGYEGRPKSVSCARGMNHLRRIHGAVELLFAYQPQLQRSLLEGKIVLQGIMGDSRCAVIA